MAQHKERSYNPPIPSDHERGSYFQKEWDKRYVYNEVFFPGEHVSHLPWQPFQWEEYDIPKHFQQIPITVNFLSHVTHDKEFGQICAEDPDAYTLLPNQKRGKSGYNTTDGSPLGYSFLAYKGRPPDEEAFYRYVGPDECILPGSYIWWSVEVNRQEIPQSYPVGYSVSNALSNKYSPYGNNKINGYIKYVLEAYQSSFPRNPSNGKLPRIEFRVGGTLRYRYEVCHVVIVCCENEEQLPLDKYPLWEEGKDKIEYDNNTSEVKWVNQIKITINNGISRKKDERYSWDHIVFGLYFPDDIQILKCPKEKEGKTHFRLDKVDHDKVKCIKSRPMNPGKKWLCPNDITRKRSGHTLEEEPLPKK